MGNSAGFMLADSDFAFVFMADTLALVNTIQYYWKSYEIHPCIGKNNINVSCKTAWI
jgi:hypothetical protein